MNANAQFLTITPEQLKKFDEDKQSLISDVECTIDVLNQMSTLFCLISKISKEQNPSILQIQNLSGLGHYMCDDWLGAVESIESQIKELSPFESTKA